MARQYSYVKVYDEFLGVDLKSSDILRSRLFAEGGQNVSFTTKNGIQKRQGYQFKYDGSGGSGLYTYNRKNLTTGIDEPEIISFIDKAYRLVKSTITVTYTGPDTAEIEFTLDTSANEYRFILKDNSVELINDLVGRGYDETTIHTITDLKNSIDAQLNFSATINGDVTDVPTAFVKVIRSVSTTAGTMTLDYEYLEEINATVSSPLAGTVSNKSSDDYENVSAVNLNNCLYVANGYDDLHKYDGQTFYKAGLPKPSAISSATVGGGSLTGSYAWGYTYIQIDNAGQVIESTISDDTTETPTAESVNVTLSNLTAGTGYNTNCAIVAGAQITVTEITVDDGSGGSHTMKVGDTAYFFDSVSGGYVSRTVTAVSATSITIDGAAVTVADNAVISNNLRIALYRTVDSGTFKFLVAEIPNNSFASTQVYNDDLADVSLGAQFIVPFFAHDTPPKGKYLTVFQNTLVITGDLSNTSRFYWSDETPEYFPAASHAADVEAGVGDKTTGCGVASNQLAIFKKKSIFVVSGDLPNLNFRVDQLTSNDLGCVAHATIQEVREGIIYFLTDRGPYFLVGGQLPKPVGSIRSKGGGEFSRIEPFFTQTQPEVDKIPITKRAVAINDSKNTRYVLYVPSEDVGDNPNSNANSVVWVFDYTRSAWFPNWTAINAAGGLALLDNELYWSERKTISGSATYKITKMLDTNDEFDFADHENPISFQYRASWEHLGEPSIFKKWLRLNVFVLDNIESGGWNLDIKSAVDFEESDIVSDITVSFGDADSLGWGIDGWGEFPWGDPSSVNKKIKFRAHKSKAMQIIFENNEIHKNVLISGWEIELVAPYRHIKE